MSLSSSTRTPSSSARGAGRSAGGGTNRLPSSRERRPALAALAVILILLGAAGSALIALNSGNREGYVAIATKEPMPPGHRLQPGDLARGDLAGATEGLIKWSEKDRYLGQYTTGWLYNGQYLNKNNLQKDTPIPSAGAELGVVLEAGRAPAGGLIEGDIVQVVRVPSANQDAAGLGILVTAAEVTASAGGVVADKTSTVNTLNVTILVPSGKAPAVAAAAAAKTLVLVKLNPATKPDLPRVTGAN
ncbi:hypothetical protein HPO96_12550 [Kribbella sandramycini]|uniref:SAF domain-containing protein n=1 Tax=Kribbella sandramycini TaxID=60450 RepID=A0A7Y4NZP1_9ACTN|nr:hypothetical protein [Kribbella sandramycini]MBB6569083.1 hypothetical protein [Kribbella sandramycini]NOL41073.1 hypothetical protein [Kribbella sandramycini]